MINRYELNRLYAEIQNCHVCPQMDKEKALRLVQAANAESDVFIVAQTLAANQVRKSGVNFFQADGRLGNTGRSLEPFLNSCGRTVYPQQAVTIFSGSVIPRCKPGYITVYNSEIAHCYPGKKAYEKGDRTPTDLELRMCIGKGFLLREINLIKPRLILPMGKASRNAFFSHILKTEYPQLLTEHIQNIVTNGELPRFTVEGLSFHVLPIQHASGANTRFRMMLNDSRVTGLVKEVLDG